MTRHGDVCVRPFFQVDVKGTGLEHLVNGSMGKALSVYALNPADQARVNFSSETKQTSGRLEPQVNEFLTKMKLDPNELVSVEDIAPQSEDGTVVVTQRPKVTCLYSMLQY